MANSGKSDSIANTVRSVERAVNLLEILMSTTRSLSLAELSEKAELHPSTAHRLLATLDKKEFIRQDLDSKQYSLGRKLLLLAEGSRFFDYLRNQAIPILHEITDVLGESASFSIRNGHKARVLAQASSGRQVDVMIQPAIQAPLHCTAVGKTILAHLSPFEIQQIIDETGLPRQTPNTITNAEELKRGLEDVRQRGYATDLEEWIEGIRCVAVPVFSNGQNVIGAISVSMPASRLTAEQEIYFSDVIKKFAGKLTQPPARDLYDGE